MHSRPKHQHEEHEGTKEQAIFDMKRRCGPGTSSVLRVFVPSCRGGRRCRFLGPLFVSLLLAEPCGAAGENWPVKPVRWILSQPAGSSPDATARLISEQLARRWGQGIVVDNRPGGQNVIGAQIAARARPDGYTYFYATTAALVINSFTFKSLPYDPRRDFVPVG